MSNAFWGGFADSLKGYIDRDMEEKRMEEQEKRKMQFLQELEKWKQENIIESSEFDPKTGELVYFNGAGKEMSRRPASQAQIEAYQSDKKKTALSERQAEAQVGLAEFNLQSAPRSLESELAARAASARSSDANARYMDAMAKGEIGRGATGGKSSGGGGSLKPNEEVKINQELLRLERELAVGGKPDAMGQVVPLSSEEKRVIENQIKVYKRMLFMGGNVPYGATSNNVMPPKPSGGLFGNPKL